MMKRNDTRWRGRRLLLALAAPILALGLAGCDLDDLLDVDDPEVASPGSVRTPTALPVVLAGVVRDFTFAYSGTGAIGGGGDDDSQIMLSGLLTDELIHTGTFPTRRLIDRRAILTNAENDASDNGTIADAYHNLHRARRAAETADQLYLDADEPDDAGRALASGFAGFSYVLFGELYCEGVPYSSIALDGTISYGPPSTRQETFDTAIVRFENAMDVAEAADDEEALNMARVGLARALLNQGDYDGAAAVAADVPNDFEYLVEHSANSEAENNGVFIYSNNAGRYGVMDDEGGNGLDWVSSDDPRTPVIFNPRDAFDTNLEEFVAQNKYPTRESPVVLASGKEARLIEAEAALQNGDIPGMLANLNAARAQDGVDALTLLDIPADFDSQVDLLFRERGFSLWLTAHRLGDLRRMIRQYGRDSEDVFPSGNYFRAGAEYGTDVNFPIYVDENNNPEFTGCLNRDA
ncbi:MAG TPA: hypothetical protein VK966_04865 [Longimicrobiales bacterium]|nr:hypothetical protein [Longimicrobiales bacterium]